MSEQMRFVGVGVGGASCMERTRETHERRVKSSARLCKALHDCASARSDWPAKPSGSTKQPKSLRLHPVSQSAPAHTRSQATASHLGALLLRSWPNSLSGRLIRRHDVAALSNAAGVDVAHRICAARRLTTRKCCLLGLTAADEHVLPELINVDRLAVEVREPRRGRLRRAARQGQRQQNHQFPHPHALQRGARLSGMPV